MRHIESRQIGKISKGILAGAILLGSAQGCGETDKTVHSLQNSPTTLETFTPTLSASTQETPTKTEILLRPLDAYIKPESIKALNPTVSSLKEETPLLPAELDNNGQWILPNNGDIFSHIHPENKNQIVMFGHARWQGNLLPSGELMLNSQIGDTFLFGGVTNIIPDNQEIPGAENALEAVPFTLTGILVTDEHETARLMNEKQEYEKPTIILVSSFRVNAAYDPSEYYVLSKDVILGKATHVTSELDNSELYKHVIAVFEISEEGSCAVIKEYKNYTSPPGFLTPQEQCPTE